MMICGSSDGTRFIEGRKKEYVDCCKSKANSLSRENTKVVHKRKMRVRGQRRVHSIREWQKGRSSRN